MFTLVRMAVEELGQHCLHLHPVKAGGDYHFHQKARLELICLLTRSGEDGGPWGVPAAPLERACCTVTLLPTLPISIIK